MRLLNSAHRATLFLRICAEISVKANRRSQVLVFSLHFKKKKKSVNNKQTESSRIPHAIARQMITYHPITEEFIAETLALAIVWMSQS